MLGRRSFIAGFAALITAPAIVRYGSLMPVRNFIIAPEQDDPVWEMIGKREDIMNVVYRIAPTMTPMHDMFRPVQSRVAPLLNWLPSTS